MRPLIIYNAFLDVIRILDTAFCQLENGMNLKDLIDHYRPSARGRGKRRVIGNSFLKAPPGPPPPFDPKIVLKGKYHLRSLDLLMDGITAI